MIKLLYYPSSILLRPCIPVEKFDQELHDLLDGMKTIMETHQGLGISANQVGKSLRVYLAAGKEFINPAIIKVQGSALLSEGCLSAPGIFVNITRHDTVTLSFYDRNGKEYIETFTGMDARCILHEQDHINGEWYFRKITNRHERRKAESMARKLF